MEVVWIQEDLAEADIWSWPKSVMYSMTLVMWVTTSSESQLFITM